MIGICGIQSGQLQSGTSTCRFLFCLFYFYCASERTKGSGPTNWIPKDAWLCFKLRNGARLMMVGGRYDLTDVECLVIKPLLPRKWRGVKRVDDRRVLNGISWMLRSGCAVARVRRGATCRSATGLTRPPTTAKTGWRKAGLWDRLMDEITKVYDGNVQMIDSSIVRVHQHAAGAKKGVEIVAWAVLEAD